MTKNNKERFNQEERRTYPCYLTGSEYARERRRLDNMVDGFLKWNPIKKVGETENFIIEIDLKERIVYLQEKSIVADCPFKLSMKPDEVKDIIKQLTKGLRSLISKNGNSGKGKK